jgi:hypothetical protein
MVEEGTTSALALGVDRGSWLVYLGPFHTFQPTGTPGKAPPSPYTRWWTP